ncbi:MAG: tRNA dihydrouridine synthase DusB [Verrucomicrobia bacterium]|nr:tRNA dihydrouridine synthase DusB [Verrucomicrobiota bacterium]
MRENPVRPIKLGSLQLPSNIFYAPLAGCSDFPFRKMASQYHPGLKFCEMTKIDALVRYDMGTFHILDYSYDMHPIGAQLCGSNPQLAGKAARIIEDLGFDVLDFNCGCPVDKVLKDGSGSGMLKHPYLIGEIISNFVAAVRIPVTVKIRAGWDDDSLVFREIVKIAESAGAKAITIHARTREQAYKGPARWEWITAAKEEAKDIIVVGNGDIFAPQDALDMFEKTKCDAVLVARGSLGQPWISTDIEALARGETLKPHSLEARRQALIEHLDYILRYSTDRRAIIDMRRVGCWYFPKSKETKQFREVISHADSIEQIKSLIYEFPFEDEEEENG